MGGYRDIFDLFITINILVNRYITMKNDNNNTEETIIRVESIGQLHEISGYGKPKHPLITIIDYSKIEFDYHLIEYEGGHEILPEVLEKVI